MHEPIWVPREQIRRRIQEAGWRFAKKQTEKVELFRLPNSAGRMDLPKSPKLFPESLVRITLGRAGLNGEEVEQFLRDCVTEAGPPKKKRN